MWLIRDIQRQREVARMNGQSDEVIANTLQFSSIRISVTSARERPDREAVAEPEYTA